MDHLIKAFLNESKENQKLYNQAIFKNNEKALDILNEKFCNYLLRNYFYSYVNKSVSYASIKFKKKNQLLSSTEMLSLNAIDPSFNEEIINTIPDESHDYTEKINQYEHNYTWKDLISDEKIFSAINDLTDKQKDILYMKFVQDKEETEIAQILGISRQAVNKTKNTTIKKLRSQIGGV